MEFDSLQAHGLLCEGELHAEGLGQGSEVVLLLPQAHGESSLSALCGLGLDDATSEVGLEHTSEGSLALVALPLLKSALVVDYQDGDSFSSEGLDALLEEAYYVPGSFRVALESGS